MASDLTLDELLDEYVLARAWTASLTGDLTPEHLAWRPEPASSAILWHLGHQGAVNHFMIRNLMSAEPSPDPDLDSLFDSATPEIDRGDLPDPDRVRRYRYLTAERTVAMIDRIRSGDVGAPRQLDAIARGVLTAVTNHEYQHCTWIAEMREVLGHPAAADPASGRVVNVEGYWML